MVTIGMCADELHDDAPTGKIDRPDEPECASSDIVSDALGIDRLGL